MRIDDKEWSSLLSKVTTLQSEGIQMTPFEKKATLAGLVIGIISAVIAALGLIPSTEPKIDQPPVIVQVENDIEENKISDLSKILDGASLGRHLDFFESIAGPAEKIDQGWRFYTIENCRILIFADENKNITRLRMKINNVCDFEWRNIDPSFSRLSNANSTTIDEFIDVYGISGLSGCFIYCGNNRNELTDSTIGVHIFGSNSNNNIDTKISADLRLTQGQRLNLHAFENALQSQLSEQFIIYDELCDDSIFSQFRDAVAGARIDTVEFSLQYLATDDVHPCQ